MSEQKKNSQAQPDSGAAQQKQPVQERAGGGPASHQRERSEDSESASLDM